MDCPGLRIFTSLSFLIALSTLADAQDRFGPIEELEANWDDLTCFEPDQNNLGNAHDIWMPQVIRSAEEAGPFFTPEYLEQINGQVDWENQYVLVFAWVGAGGGDVLSYAVAESFPEQIYFDREHGFGITILTRYAAVFALRNDVTWHYNNEEE